ncbi:Alg9-like mannosyltransferase family-domain-containing protein [Auriculariales sp. MPI-PUGE-AT-0066]|nr:Alg9-like mannosyltransferase family-domain-containing protein [Auriculariales sp. MPI-PUGE-AT-0066]
MRRQASRLLGSTAGVFFTLISVTQFHLPFWASRTLPNMFALAFVNITLAHLVSNARQKKQSATIALCCLVFAGVTLRAELALFVGPVALQMLISRDIPFVKMVVTGLLAAIWLWPELYSVWFNVYEGKSAEWGVSPPYEYVLKYIPKLAMSALPLAMFGALDGRTWPALFPSAIFIGLISCLGHKEWRFVVYIIPLINAAAASGAAALWKRRESTGTTALLRLSVIGLLVANSLATVVLTCISMLNYPGGFAMKALDVHLNGRDNVHVHICNYAAQSGASLFTQTHDNWVYNKTEHLTAHDLTVSPWFTHAVVEDFTRKRYPEKRWRVLEEVHSFSGIRTQPLPAISARPQLWVLEKI